MMRRSCTLASDHMTAPYLMRGGLKILTALALAFVLAGASPSSLAQAAPASETINFDFTVIPSAKFVCANDSMTFRVFMVRRITSSNPDIPPRLKKIPGTPIDATVADRSIGTITPDRLETGSGTYEPGVAEFTFTAGENPGQTNIFFEGLVIPGWFGEKLAKELYINKTVQVEVRKCGYKAELIQQHMAQYDYGWIAKGDEIKLNADSTKHFSGTTDFKYSYDIPEWAKICLVATNTPTTVDYSVDQVGDKLYFTYTISAHSTTASAPCIGYSQTVETPSLSGTVLLPSTGDVALIELPFTLNIIIVERVEDP